MPWEDSVSREAKQFASKMRALFAVAGFVLLIFSSRPCHGDSLCECYEPELKKIVTSAAKSNGLSLSNGAEDCPEKTSYVLTKLKNRLDEVKPGASHYKMLVDKIRSKSSDLGIPNEGLISGRTRLRKLLKYYEDRHANKINQIVRLSKRGNKCKGTGSTIEHEMDQLKRNHRDNISTISDLQDYLNCLKIQNKVFQAKLHKNSAALHGSSGIITGNLVDAKECVAPDNVDLLKLSDNSKLASL